MDRVCGTHGKMKHAYAIFLENLKGREHVGIPRRRW